MMTASRSVAAALGVGVALMMILGAPVSAQCSICRRAFDSPEGRQLVSAFRSGILFLLAAPFVSFGTVAWLAVRRQRRRAAAFESKARL